ncbi:P-loop containing nucleoside triphosphate hydrolase protein [Favolaschia claudopus]|uniref:P-loop containing nucleoside triphosphate hydrolase protein n=1 Tax=Favolaschia claudopus TaxID=2862362 RepID=A0AAW0BIQ3_9AGAR
MNDLTPVKCVLLGDTGVGKTRLLNLFAYSPFGEGWPLVNDWAIMHYMVKDKTYGFEVLDISAFSGSAELTRFRRAACSQADVFVLCFSLALPSSLASIRDDYIQEANHYRPGAPCIVVATHLDLPGFDAEGGQESISHAHGEKLAFEIGAKGYFECSAEPSRDLRESAKDVRPVFDLALQSAIAHKAQTRKQCPEPTRSRRRCVVV